MSYSQALEEQMRLLAMVKDGRAQKALSHMDRTGDFYDLHRKMMVWFGHTLEKASPYYWSPEMCDLLESVAREIPSTRFRREDLVTPFGFMHFAKPVQLPSTDDGADCAPIGAIGWASAPEDLDVDIVVSIYTMHTIGSVGHLRFPFTVYPYSYGEQFDWINEREDEIANGKAQRAACRYIAAAFALCSQRILTTPQERAERPIRKRATAHLGYEPLVRVVKLRRASTGERDHDGEKAYELTCQFVVRGHWKLAPCGPHHSERRPVFVLPYVKGPEGAPIKPPRSTVFEVVR